MPRMTRKEMDDIGRRAVTALAEQPPGYEGVQVLWSTIAYCMNSKPQDRPDGITRAHLYTRKHRAYRALDILLEEMNV